MVIFIPPIAISLIAGAVLIYVLFGMTDWWEIIGIVIGFAFIAYMLPDIAKALPA